MSKYQSISMKDIPFSGIRKVVEQATQMEEQGMNVIHLEIGRPDFDTPDNIKEAAKKALDDAKIFYTSNYGIIELRRAISSKLLRDNELKYDPENEIIVTAGVSEAVFDTVFSFLDAGDEILIPNPVWLNYFHIPRMVGAKPVYYNLLEDNDYQIDIDEIKRKITNKTKMMVLISPNNPTGGVLSESILKQLADIAVENDILVVSDEIYEKIIFDGYKHISIAKFPGMKERTIILNGFSKAYSMTGWRLGYIASSPEIISVLIKTHQYNATSASSFSQWAAIEALENSDYYVKKMVEEYQRRKDHVVNVINSIEKLSCKAPKGSFYLFINIKNLNKSSEAAAYYLLKNCGVSTVPGNIFGEMGEGYIRLSFAAKYESLVEAGDRIKKLIGNY